MKRDSFSKNLYTYVLLSLLIPISLLSFLLIIDEYRYFKELRFGVFEEHLQKQTAHVNEWSQYKSSLLNKSKLLMEVKIQQGDPTGILIDVLDRIEQTDADILNTYYTDETGLNIVSGGRVGKVDGRKRVWYEGAMAQGTFISLPYKDVLTNEEVLTYSVAIENAQGERIGVLGIDIRVSDLLGILQKNVQNINGRLILMDGYAVVDSDTKDIPYAVIERFKRNRSERQYFHDGKQYYIKAIGVRNYQVVYIIDADAYIRSYFSRGNDSFFRFIAAIIVILFLASYMINKTTRPFKDLHKQVRGLIADKNMDDKEISDPDLALVMEQFTRFNTHMMTHIEALKRTNDELDIEKVILQKNHDALNNAVSDLQDANLQLIEKERYYKNVLENISDLIWVIDENGAITYVGKTLLETMELSESDVIGKHVGWLFGMEGHDGDDLFEILKQRDFDSMELHMSGSVDSIRKIVDTRTTRQSINGEFKSLLGISRDISAEKKSYIDYFYKNREMFVINEVNRAMTSSGNELDVILKSITDKISHLMNVSFATVRIMRHQCLDLAAVSGTIHRYIYGERIDLGNTHLGEALIGKRIINIKSKDDLLFEEALLEEAMDTMSNIIFIPLLNKENSFGVLTVGSKKSLDDDKLNILEYLAQSASIAIERSIIYEQLRNNYLKTIEALANALEEKLYNMHGHTLRVSRIASVIAGRLFLKQSQIDAVHIAGLLHDIGKIGINDEYLKHRSEPGHIHGDEVSRIMGYHPVIGKKILKPIGLSDEILDGIYYHHKRYDLKGYPEDDVQEQPLLAQIIQMSDALDNMLLTKDIKSFESLDALVPWLKDESGKQFGPEIVDVVIELIEDQPSVLIDIIAYDS